MVREVWRGRRGLSMSRSGVMVGVSESYFPLSVPFPFSLSLLSMLLPLSELSLAMFTIPGLLSASVVV